jgi:hypothetical protein
MEQPLRIPAKIGLIAACVPAIECYQRLYTILGERFLTVRHRPNRIKAAEQALANLGKEDGIRGELCGITTVFLKSITPKEITLESNMKGDILKLADALACMRTPVPHGTFTQDGLETFTPTIEYPTCISKQLLKLSKLLALIRGKTTAGSAELATVKRVARDSCIQNRLKILDNLPPKKSRTTRELSDAAKIPLMTCWRDLKEMESLHLVEYMETNEAATDGWKLADDTLVSLTHPERRVGE